MKYVTDITEAELKTLEAAHKNHQTARVRNRAHVIILSHKGFQMQKIAEICGIDRHAVSRVINNWKKFGIRGLYDAPRSGRPKILTPEDEEFVHGLVEEEPRSTKKIIITLEDQRGKTVSSSTIRRVIKKKRVWKRIRKSLKNKRDEEKFRKKQEEIRELEERREKGEIDVQYFDGAGFNETPCVPYAYQPKGEYIELTPARGQTLNVLGFMNKDNECTPFVFECTINSDVVTACFDNFVNKYLSKSFVP
ncbi:MAG: IS630 family transposase [Desulfobacteraceae bacterium]|nr:IS630 family transposase [Desulfobacteraceae bacterium]